MRRSPQNGSVGPTPTFASSSDRHVLVVNADVPSANGLVDAVRQLGYAVVAATTWTEALALGEFKRPHIALIVVDDPRLDGHELGRRFRTLDWGWRIAMAAIADSADDTLRRTSTHAGFDVHVAPLPPIREFMAQLAVRTVG